MSIQESLEKIKSFFVSKKGEDAMVIMILCLASFGSFGLGRLSAAPQKAVSAAVIENARVSSSNASGGLAAVTDKGAEPFSPSGPVAKTGEPLVVASKNGTKYYLPWCTGQSRIHEGNKISFATEADAIAAGYEKASTCKDL